MDEQGGSPNLKQLHGVGLTFKQDGKLSFSVKRITEGGPADVAGTVDVA